MKINIIKKILFVSAIFLATGNSCVYSEIKTLSDPVSFVEFTEDTVTHNWIVVKASINCNADENFMLDTGGNDVISIDSAYFFDHFKTDDYTFEPPRIKMWYWESYVKGDFVINIGNHTFTAHKLHLYNFSKKHIESLKGLIGYAPFENKMTIIDYDNKKIAFCDTLAIDSTYFSLKFQPARVITEHNRHLRFLDIKGFKDKKGNPVPGLFLFDTGNTLSGLLMKRSFGLKIKNEKKNLKKVPAALLGNNEYVYNWSFKLDSISIGNINLLGVPARYEVDAFDRIDALTGADGLLGLVLLRAFNMVIDYKNNIFYYKPNKSFPSNKMY
jgi:hypothetical protein